MSSQKKKDMKYFFNPKDMKAISIVKKISATKSKMFTTLSALL